MSFFGQTTYTKRDLLTGDQQKTLDSYGKAGRGAVDTLSQLGQQPRTAYSQMANAEQEFQQGVVNPAMNQLNTNLANLSHSNERHSSANQRLRNQTVGQMNDRLAGMRYDMLNRERGMQMQDLQNAYGQQIGVLGQLGNYGNSALNTRAFEYQQNYKPGFLDILGGVTGAIGAVGNAAGTIFGR